MTQADEQYYQELFEMFATPGWGHFQEYLKKVHTAQAVGGWQLPAADLAVNKGVVANLSSLMNFQAEHESAYAQLQAGDDSGTDD